MKEKKRKLHWYQTRKVRNSLKRAKKAAGYFFTFLGSAILIYVLCTFVLSRISVKGQSNKGANIQIYLMKSGVHTDFILPVRNDIKDWRTEFPLSHSRHLLPTTTRRSPKHQLTPHPSAIRQIGALH